LIYISANLAFQTNVYGGGSSVEAIADHAKPEQKQRRTFMTAPKPPTDTQSPHPHKDEPWTTYDDQVAPAEHLAKTAAY
jgi:hypothetical protein